MARLTLKMVDERVQALGGKAAYNRDFIFDLLLAYGRSSSTVTRLRSGNLNVAADPGREVALKNVVYFREIAATDHDSGVILHALESLRKESYVFRLYPRFVMVSDYQDLAAYDMKTGENLIIPIVEVGKHFAFFLPWAGMEKAQYVEEAHADVKAAEQMGKLFDQLLSLNPGFWVPRAAGIALTCSSPACCFVFSLRIRGFSRSRVSLMGLPHIRKRMVLTYGSILKRFLTIWILRLRWSGSQFLRLTRM